MPVDKKTLNQYRALLREIPKLKKDIQKLNDKLDKIPTVAGKVMKSSDDFPYIVEHVKVDIQEPKLADELRKQIRYKELRLSKAERDKTAIEQFIAGIEDSVDRQIFEMLYTNEKRMSQTEVGDTVGYTQGRISQIISSYLKD